MSLTLTSFMEECLPQPLLELSAQSCVLHPESIGKTDTWTLHDSVTVPTAIAIKLIRVYQKTTDVTNHEARRRFLGLFLDSAGNRVWNFPGDPLVYPSDQHSVYLDYTHNSFSIKNGESSLSQLSLPRNNSKLRGLTLDYGNLKHLPFPTSGLQRLTVTRVCETGLAEAPTCLQVPFATSATLTHLNLKGMLFFNDIDFISGFPHLKWLSLTGVMIPNLEPIFELSNLIYLDLSFRPDLSSPSEFLSILMKRLKRLQCLDISETNLDADGLGGIRQSRSKSNPLQELGLYRTKYDGCRIPDLPAKIVAGHANRAQIEATLRMYAGCERQIIILKEDGVIAEIGWQSAFEFLLDFVQKRISTPHVTLCLQLALFTLGKIVDDNLPDIPLATRQAMFENLLNLMTVCRIPSGLVNSAACLLMQKLSIITFRNNPVLYGRFLSLLLRSLWDEADSTFYARCQLRSALLDQLREFDLSDDGGMQVICIVNDALKNIVGELQHRKKHSAKCSRNEERKIKETLAFVGKLIQTDDSHRLVPAECRTTLNFLRRYLEHQQHQ